MRARATLLVFVTSILIAACGGNSKPDLGVFAKDWYSHGVDFRIDVKGSGSAHWRTYNVCGQDPPPCDTFRGNSIVDGGRATFVVTHVDGDRATGRITASNDPSFKVGPLELTYDRQLDMLQISPRLDDLDRLCGPKADPGACGA